MKFNRHLNNRNFIEKDSYFRSDRWLISQAIIKEATRELKGGNSILKTCKNIKPIHHQIEIVNIKFSNVVDIVFFISKVKHIKTYYSNFMGNTDTLYREKSIPLTPHSQVSEADPVNYTTFRTGIDLKIAKKWLIYTILNTRVTTQTLLGFVICRKILWDEGISNDPNGSCRKTSHINYILNTGGSNGYIN